MDSGWQVVSCRGPEQMDVWELLLRRRSWRVRLGIERGMSDGVVAWSEKPDGTRDQTYVRMSHDAFGDLLDRVTADRST